MNQIQEKLVQTVKDSRRSKMKKTAKSIAREILGWLPFACYDMAGGDEEEADKKFNSVSDLADLIGDRTYDECNGDRALMVEVAMEVINSKSAPEALKEAYLKKGAAWENWIARVPND